MSRLSPEGDVLQDPTLAFGFHYKDLFWNVQVMIWMLAIYSIEDILTIELIEQIQEAIPGASSDRPKVKADAVRSLEKSFLLRYALFLGGLACLGIIMIFKTRYS
mmetsp:Transcript_1869/g.2566  ORF Transcript_1869/g.2566 Transcript_1869/m.2566 type:complete len:105 (+) Transcript_1869:314-628(+)